MSNCIFCGATEATEQVKFPDTFTAYQLLQAGDKACKRCNTIFTYWKNHHDKRYITRNYYIKNDEYHEIIDALKFLEEMPTPPYILYVTKQKRKHGWINAVQNPVLNTNRFILCVDEEKLFFNRAEFNELTLFLESLWPKKMPKSVLKGGYPPAGLIRKYQLTRMECQRLDELKANRLWRFIVDFKRREENV